MIEPAIFVASIFPANNVPDYQYRISSIKVSMKDTWKYGTPHAADTGNTLWRDATPKDLEVSNQICTYWYKVFRIR